VVTCIKNHEMFVVGVQVGKWSVKGGARRTYSLLSRFIVLQFCVAISMSIRIVLFYCFCEDFTTAYVQTHEQISRK